MNRHGPRANPVGLLLSPAPWAAFWYLFGYLFTGTALFAAARLHAAIARALLRAPDDPLREAREVLRRPGPLPMIFPNGK